MISDDYFCSKDAPPELDAAMRSGFSALRKLVKEKDYEYLDAALGYIHVHHKEYRAIIFDEIAKKNESRALSIARFSIWLGIIAVLLSAIQCAHEFLSEPRPTVIIEKQLLLPSDKSLSEAFSLRSISVYAEDNKPKTSK
jgi:hypothetical protein